MIEKIKNNQNYLDVMEGYDRWNIKVHTHGLSSLVDVMPRLVPKGKTADFAVVQAARVSYGDGTKQLNEDEGLIRYLYRHRHTTPFEMVEFKLHCIMPIFIARQWIRHRTANVNEYSARYSVIKDRFYKPERHYLKKQSSNNKQGGEELLEDSTAQEFLDYLDKSEFLYKDYEQMLSKGVSRELARIALPSSIYTEWYWKIDLHNLLHFLSLRADSHAQQEIQDYANAILQLITPIVPITIQAFNDYHPNRNGMILTALEIEALKNKSSLNTTNQREINEWNKKKERLRLL